MAYNTYLLDSDLYIGKRQPPQQTSSGLRIRVFLSFWVNMIDSDDDKLKYRITATSNFQNDFRQRDTVSATCTSTLMLDF